MAIGSRFPGQADSYERTVTGWVDRGEGSLLEFYARLADGRVDLEVRLVAEPSPSYQLTRATATARSEATRERCGPLLEAFPAVGQLRIVGGFRRQVAALLGEHPVADDLLDATIEAARLSRQV